MPAPPQTSLATNDRGCPPPNYLGGLKDHLRQSLCTRFMPVIYDFYLRKFATVVPNSPLLWRQAEIQSESLIYEDLLKISKVKILLDLTYKVCANFPISSSAY